MSGEGVLRGRPLIHAPMQFRLRSGGSQAKDKAFLTCPNCDAPMFVRDSQRETETVKSLIVHCTNSGCGVIGASQVVFVHYYSPGVCLRPELALKACPRDQIPHVLPPPRDEGEGEQISMFGGPS